MYIEKITNKSDMFKLQFEEIIKPYIYKQIKNDDAKVVLSMKYITENSGTNYNIDTLYIKMRNMLLGTKLDISIRRKSKEFAFYEISDVIKRESDLIRIGFEKRLKPCLLEIFRDKYIIGFEEDNLREVLDVNCSTINIYNSIKNLLSDTGITVSTRKNELINGKKVCKFVFYDINKKRQYDEDKIGIEEVERKRRKDVIKNIKKENEEIVDDVNAYLDDINSCK